MQRRIVLSFLFTFICALFHSSQANAVITALIPLSDMEKQDFIFVAKVKEILPEKPALVLEFVENLKGTAPFDRLPVNLTGNPDAKKGKHSNILLERIEKDLPIIVMTKFIGGKHVALGYTNGTWFQFHGRVEKAEGMEIVRWSFQCCEPYLRRTFKGTTEELKAIIVDMVAKKKQPPLPDDKEKPGYGPPIEKKSALPVRGTCTNIADESDKRSGVNYPLAVIQLPFLGLIAGLAALFPTVFGGLALFMKRWVAVLSTSGLVSLFVSVPMIAPGWCARQWLFTPAGMWLSCAALFGMGALWSLRRYRCSIDRGEGESMQPQRFDRLGLSILTVAGTVALFVGVGLQMNIWSNHFWRWVIAGTIAFCSTTFVMLTTYLRTRRSTGKFLGRIASETVLLWVLAATCVAFGSWEWGKYSNSGIGLVQGSGGIGQPTLNLEPIWKFAPEGGGVVVSSCATADRIFLAVMMSGLTERHGRVYALDAQTGVEQWRFDNDYEKDSDKGMKPAFSTPVFADGRLYFGEGLHTDSDSRLFCLDAATGTKLWEYKTESHTESSPVVADGKVVFGAGYHGIHCLDAVNGPGADNIPLWRYPPDAKAEQQALHVDCNPIVANGRVYAGSGYKPEYISKNGKINTIFCLDLNTGAEIWSDRVDDAVYGSPLADENRIYFGTGNSTYSETFPSTRPGILCRDATTGGEIWYCRLPENVMGRPVADKRQLFVGCLDGKGYALDKQSGAINWSIEVGGPVLASPVVDINGKTNFADVVYFVGNTGTVTAVSPYSAAVFWSVPLTYWTNSPTRDLSATPSLIRLEDDKMVRRRLLIGFGMGLGDGSTVPRLYCIEDQAAK